MQGWCSCFGRRSYSKNNSFVQVFLGVEADKFGELVGKANLRTFVAGFCMLSSPSGFVYLIL